jgi:hypothetical protein
VGLTVVVAADPAAPRPARVERCGEPVQRRRAAGAAPPPDAWKSGRVAVGSIWIGWLTNRLRRSRCPAVTPATPGKQAKKADCQVGPDMNANDFNISVTASFEPGRGRNGRTANTTLPPVLQRNGGILCRNMAGG